MFEFIKKLFRKPEPESTPELPEEPKKISDWQAHKDAQAELRRRSHENKLKKANEDWAKYGLPEFDQRLEFAVSQGKFAIGLKWGEELYFILPKSEGYKWAKSKGLTLHEPDRSAFWSLRW